MENVAFTIQWVCFFLVTDYQIIYVFSFLCPLFDSLSPQITSWKWIERLVYMGIERSVFDSLSLIVCVVIYCFDSEIRITSGLDIVCKLKKSSN